MDEQRFNEAVRRLHEVNRVVVELDPAIRSQAFALLSGYVTGSADDLESELLQVLMDQKATLEEMITNLMKSISDTQNALVKNLK
jgi:hypothetical protein